MAIKTVDIGSVIATDNIITRIQDKLPLGFVKRVDLGTASVKFTVKKQPNVLTERFHVVFYGQNTASLEAHFFSGFSNDYIFNSPYGSCGSAIQVKKKRKWR